jgi:hypothetical protein
MITKLPVTKPSVTKPAERPADPPAKIETPQDIAMAVASIGLIVDRIVGNATVLPEKAKLLLLSMHPTIDLIRQCLEPDYVAARRKGVEMLTYTQISARLGVTMEAARGVAHCYRLPRIRGETLLAVDFAELKHFAAAEALGARP